MKPLVYAIPIDTKGALYQMPKPSGERLVQDIAHIRSLGVDTICSMLEPTEAAGFALTGEAAACAAHDIAFLQRPVRDLAVPDGAMITELVSDLVSELQAGRNVAVHCRAGIGRSGIVTCLILCRLGLGPEQAIATVSTARGVPVPDTRAQADFIHEQAGA